MFNTSEYRKCLETEWLGTEFQYLEQTDSTNTLLRRVPTHELVHGTVMLADQQLKGRGQFQRQWHSEPFRNLTFTIGLKPDTSSAPSLITPSAALAVVTALNEQWGDHFYIKWPNDLMVNGRKFGGILTECVFNGSRLDRVLIGIGLNVNQAQFPEPFRDRATSLMLETGGEPLHREWLLAHLLASIEGIYTRWVRGERSLIRDINRLMEGYGQWVGIRVNGQVLPEEMKFLGINEDGHLVALTSEIEVIRYTYEQIRIESHH